MNDVRQGTSTLKGVEDDGELFTWEDIYYHPVVSGADGDQVLSTRDLGTTIVSGKQTKRAPVRSLTLTSSINSW